MGTAHSERIERSAHTCRESNQVEDNWSIGSETIAEVSEEGSSVNSDWSLRWSREHKGKRQRNRVVKSRSKQTGRTSKRAARSVKRCLLPTRVTFHNATDIKIREGRRTTGEGTVWKQSRREERWVGRRGPRHFDSLQDASNSETGWEEGMLVRNSRLHNKRGTRREQEDRSRRGDRELNFKKNSEHEEEYWIQSDLCPRRDGGRSERSTCVRKIQDSGRGGRGTKTLTYRVTRKTGKLDAGRRVTRKTRDTGRNEGNSLEVIQVRGAS